MQQLLIQQQLSRRSPATVEPLNKSIPMQSTVSPPPSDAEGQHNLTRTQQQLNAALFNTDSESLLLIGNGLSSSSGAPATSNDNKYAMNSNRNSTGIVDEDANDRELHMAEQLVANADRHQRSAFQFDTIEPKARRNAAAMSLMQESGIGEEKKETEINVERY